MWSETLVAVTCFATVRSFHLGAAQLSNIARLSSLQAENLARHQVLISNLINFNAQNNLAQTALHAAEAARVILNTKKFTVRVLEERLKEAEKLLEEEITHYYVLKEVAVIFARTAKESENLTAVLRGLLEDAQKIALQQEVIGVLAEAMNQTDVSFGVGFH